MKYTLLIVLLSCGLIACDSANEALDSTAEAQATTANVAVQSGMTTGIQAAFSSGFSKLPTANCQQGGTVTTGDVVPSGSSFDIGMTFDECNQMSGTLNIAYTASASSVESRLNGSLGGLGCDITYSGFRTTAQTQAQTVVLNGSYGARCTAGSVTCSYTNVSISTTDGEAAARAYQDGCKAS